MNKEMEKKIVPKLRFPDFEESDSWVEKKLSEVTSSIFDGTHQTPRYTEKGVPFFSVENLISGNKNKFITEEDHALATIKNKPEKGDILMTRIGNIGFPKIVDWDYDFSIYVTLAVIKKSENFDSHYLHSFFQSDYYQKEVKSKSLLNAVPCKINMDELRKTKVLLPPDKYKIEQKKIADCLSSLDDIITAENEKLDALKNHKKGLMQQLFPAEGEKLPKLRFLEFRDSGNWEEKKLAEISPAIFDGTHQTPKYTNGGVPFFSVENLISGNKNKFISIEDHQIATIKNKPEKNDVLITRIGNIGFSKIVDWDYDFSVYVTLAVIKKSDLFETNYLHCFFQSSYYQKEIKSKSLLNAVPCKINMDELRKTRVLLPPDTDKLEQRKIANCISLLDEQIKIQIKKIEDLKLHKKGLMQQLFPTIN